MIARLGYPPGDQHYFAGFVLKGEDRALWAPIAEAAAAARRAGVARTFVWALPQVARDGLFAFDGEDAEAAVKAYDAVDFPLARGSETLVATECSPPTVRPPLVHTPPEIE